MKNTIRITIILVIMTLIEGCSFYPDAYIHITNNYSPITLVQWTTVDGLIVDPSVIGVYIGDKTADTWGENLMDYKIAPESDGTVTVTAFEAKDIKIVVEDQYSAGNIGLMSTYKRTFLYYRENVTLETSDISGGLRVSLP